VPAFERAGTDFPEHFAFEIIRGDKHFVAVEEADVNPFAVGGGGGGCTAVQRMELLERRDEDDFPPEDFSVSSVERQQDSLFFIFQGGDEEDSIVPDYRACVSFAWEGGFPEYVLGIAPFDGDIFLGACPIGSGSSEGGPVLSPNER